MNIQENIQRIKEIMEIEDKDLSSSIEKVVRHFISEMDLFDDVEVIKTGENFYSIILFVNKKMAIELQSGYGPTRNRLISEIGQYLRIVFPEPKPVFNYWDIDKKDRDRIQTHKSFDKLKGFTDKLDGGGTSLNESTKKYETIKKLIDNAIDDLKHMCEQNDEDNIYIDPEDCELIESDIKVQINNISNIQGKMYIELIINYENYHHYFDEESLEWEIYEKLKKWIPNCAIKIVDMINNYPEEKRQW